MLKNYFLTAFRNFGRNKVFTIINISGLAIGISAALVIYMIVSHEFGYDTYEKDGNRIYRVVSDMMFPNNPFKLSGVPPPTGAAVRKEIAGIETVAELYVYGPVVSVAGAGKAKPAEFKSQANIFFADDNLLKLFPRKWLAGSPAALQKPFKVVLTENRAKQYFGTADAQQAMGKTITYDDSVKVTVVGVVANFTKSTDINYEEVVSLSTRHAAAIKSAFGPDSWAGVSNASQLFIKLFSGVNPAAVQKQIQQLHDSHAPKAPFKTLHKLQPLAEIHFDAEYDNFNGRQSQKNVMYGLLVVAAFLLLLGCINFINLTTAQATQRAKEIGIRKTMGGTKRQLVAQFLTETFVLTFTASAISVAVTPWLLQLFANYIPAGVSFGMVLQPQVIAYLLCLILSVSLFAGFYPAMVLSQYKPVDVLKSRVLSARHGFSQKVLLRKSLTVTQFVIAQFFIIATVVVSKQIHYALNKNLGYKKDAIVYVVTQSGGAPGNTGNFFLNKLKALPGVQTAVLGGVPPACFGISFGAISFNNGKKDIEMTADLKSGDSSYFMLYGMKLLAGRFIQQADSSTACLVNETFAKKLGFNSPQQAVGAVVRRGDKLPLRIAGVLADFHTQSLHAQIKPLLYTAAPNWYNTFSVALKPQGEGGRAWKSTIDEMQAAWKNVYPQDDFNYNFFDETIAKFYDEEQSTSVLLRWATGLAIFISCLGLLGLAIYTTNQRTKEIGVRKVLGASIRQITLLLSKDFVQLIALAFVIAVPLAWLAMHKWLQEYAYRTTLSWWVFAASGLALFTVALLVMGVRTVRAASANPVKSLRTE